MCRVVFTYCFSPGLEYVRDQLTDFMSSSSHSPLVLVPEHFLKLLIAQRAALGVFQAQSSLTWSLQPQELPFTL